MRSDVSGKGLGRMLMDKVVSYCRARCFARITGEVLATNARMLALSRSCGFRVEACGPGVFSVTMDLAPQEHV
ncbi:MAG TPA: GNAT family N-acetyltransferase [Burkholderiales bacterium]|nr:GNAT family N-acetyltransferase [Burkholderiales bacterium]